MKDLTIKDLKQKASFVKREMDELERTAHGMTFDELIRLLGNNPEKTADNE